MDQRSIMRHRSLLQDYEDLHKVTFFKRLSFYFIDFNGSRFFFCVFDLRSFFVDSVNLGFVDENLKGILCFSIVFVEFRVCWRNYKGILCFDIVVWWLFWFNLRSWWDDVFWSSSLWYRCGFSVSLRVSLFVFYRTVILKLFLILKFLFHIYVFFSSFELKVQNLTISWWLTFFFGGVILFRFVMIISI